MHMIRLVNISDASQILDVYRYYVENDSATFDVEVPTIEEMKQKIQTICKVYPYLVYEIDGVIIAYAYAHPYYGRKAYLRNVEVSIYVHKDYLHQGIGKQLYQKLFECLIELGYYKAYACITASNQASVFMHERLGFKKIGYFNQAGYKMNTWWDIVWMQKDLKAVENKVTEPKSIEHLRKL